MIKEVNVSQILIGGNNPLVLIAGPCVIEDKDICFQIAQRLIQITNQLDLPFIFKASYDKANRSSIHSYRGPGLETGLSILRQVKERYDIPILTDVHCTHDVKKVASVADIIQIPAFLCRQTDLILEVAKHAKVINVKKGQFMSPHDMKNVIEKITSVGNENILLTERGSCFGYNNLVVDFRAIRIMKSFGYPVIFDATHCVQLPGGAGISSSGEREFIPYLTLAAVSVGCDGLFMEVHLQPEKALCDGPNMLSLDELPALLKQVKAVRKVIGEEVNSEK
ncbi:MAG: 3-deoxy-8-phosphooctulonate synthase [bacterium]|nr:3-deoxy-8-phosphooctulonate synthase [bacterium]